jgi:hypothetical protein
LKKNLIKLKLKRKKSLMNIEKEKWVKNSFDVEF